MGGGFQMAVEFVTKTDVAKRAMAEVKTVEPHVAVLHHAVKLDGYGFV